MRHLLAVAVAVTAVAAPRLAAAGSGAVVVPPLEVEIGRVSASSAEGAPIVTGQILVGISWASLYPSRTPVDVSVGFISIGDTEPTTTSVAKKTSSTTEPPAGDQSNGTFVAAEVRLAEGRYWRTWAGGRGEVLSVHGARRQGGFGRMSAEIYVGGADAQGNGVFCGTVALSGWLELGARERLDGSLARVVAAGFGLRIPFLMAS